MGKATPAAPVLQYATAIQRGKVTFDHTVPRRVGLLVDTQLGVPVVVGA